MKFLEIIAMMLISVIVTGWAVSTLWGWFIVPLGVQSLSFAHAYGISVMASVFIGTRGIKDKVELSDWIKGVMFPILGVFFGFIAVQFM